MTLTLKRISAGFTSVLLLALFLPSLTFAQDAQSLSVSPTLFEMSANPGQEWSSALRIINPNPFELQLYVSVVNFAPYGESGQGKFLPAITDEASDQTIANWFEFAQTEVVVAPEKSENVSFTIAVPEEAQPGGHFAAILVGTKPPDDGEQSTRVETSQVVTSLVFLRVAGEVIEQGEIRSFRPENFVLEEPEVNFELRFQNTGNVHIQPQGEIKILNMWGQERGIVPVNKQTMFGNVLPDSIRKYSFSWTGERSMADIGRYTAVATLAYGTDGRQFTSRETSFWVIPWKIILGVLLFLVGFVVFMTWAIKLYVRKMLSIAGVSPELQQLSRRQPHHRRPHVSVVAPLEAGMLDLRTRINNSDSWRDKATTLKEFVCMYKYFFIGAALLVFFIIVIVWYARSASVSERGYQVTIEGIGGDVIISSEQVDYDKKKEASTEVMPATTQDEEVVFPAILIVNHSGVTGLAADLRLRLESEGYPVTDLRTSLDREENNTVIVYAPEYATEALELSQLIENSLLSAFAGASASDTPITVYVGRDLQNDVQ